MHIKGLLIIVVVIFGVFFYLHNINPVDVDFALNKDVKYTLPAAYLVTGGFLVGLVLLIINIIFADMRRAVREMQVRKEKRAHEAVLSNYRLGIAAFNKGNVSKARQYFIRVMEAEPAGVDIYLRLSGAYLAEGSYQDALATLERGYVNNPESIDILSRIVQIARDADDTVRLQMALGDILKVDPANPGALRALRDFALAQDDWKSASDHQRKLIYAVKGKSLESETRREETLLRGFLYEEALLCAGKDDFAAALALIKEILKSDASFVPAHILQGEIMLGQGNSKSTIRLWEHGFELTGDVIFLLKLEDIFIGSSQPERALALYKTVLISRPSDIDINIFLARLYLRLEMLDDAVSEFERIQNDLEGSYYLELLLAETYMRRSETDKAARLFKKALNLNDVPQPSFSCAQCGFGSEMWLSRCARCDEWNSFTVTRTVAVKRENPPEKLTNLSLIK
jgi:lipopolysaccharide biosynthesis regulator YciM